MLDDVKGTVGLCSMEEGGSEFEHSNCILRFVFVITKV